MLPPRLPALGGGREGHRAGCGVGAAPAGEGDAYAWGGRGCERGAGRDSAKRPRRIGAGEVRNRKQDKKQEGKAGQKTDTENRNKTENKTKSRTKCKNQEAERCWTKTARSRPARDEAPFSRGCGPGGSLRAPGGGQQPGGRAPPPELKRPTAPAAAGPRAVTAPAGAAEADGAGDWPGPDAPPLHSPVASAAAAETQPPAR